MSSIIAGDRTVLVLAPHPDDDALSMGGTIAGLRDDGVRVVSVVLTDGSRGGASAQVRRAEQELASAVLDTELLWGGFIDCALPPQAELVRFIRATISECGASLVCAPHPRDLHPDHVAVGNAALAAARGEISVLQYETPTTSGFTPNVIVPLGDDMVARKRDAIGCHASQMLRSDRRYRPWSEATCAHLGARHGVRSAEGFRAKILHLAVGLRRLAPPAVPIASNGWTRRAHPVSVDGRL